MKSKQIRSRVWGIHATEEPTLLLHSSVIAIGWKALGELSKLPRTPDGLKPYLMEKWPDKKMRSYAVDAGQLVRFAWLARTGDYVAYPYNVSNKEKVIWVGKIVGDYRFDPTATAYAHQRKVQWLGKWPRSDFNAGTLKSLGSKLTFFAIDKAADNVLQKVGVVVAEPVIMARHEVIKGNLYRYLGGDDFARFIGSLLSVIGYAVENTGRTGDHGIDIKARRKDPIYQQQLVVQVKSQRENIAEAQVQQLRGLLPIGQIGVFVTLSDFSKAAQRFLKEHDDIVGINGERVAELALEYEDKLRDKWPLVFSGDHVVK